MRGAHIGKDRRYVCRPQDLLSMPRPLSTKPKFFADDSFLTEPLFCEHSLSDPVHNPQPNIMI